MSQLHQWANSNYFRLYPGCLRMVARVLLGIIWPFRLIQLAWIATCRFGAEITELTGQSRLSQLGTQLSYGLRHQLLPLDYYRYALYLTPRQYCLSDYLLQHEVYPLSQQLNAAGITEPIALIVADKLAFADFCTAHGLPSPSVLWSNQQGGDFPDPHCSVFVKQRRGARAEGAMLWQYQGNGQYLCLPDGRSCAWEEAKCLLKQGGQQIDCLVQPCLFNHAELTDLSVGVLSTLRVLTGLRPDGVAEVIAATFKMPFRSQQIHSTISLNSPLDLKTGKLGAAFLYRACSRGHDHHPVSNARITGRILPDWKQALALSVEAHQRLQAYTFLGWDVALTQAGPMLLEANAGWDVATIQKPQQIPLGQTRLKDIYRLWMEQT